VRLLVLLFVAVVVVGCGEKRGRYAKFDDDVTAKSWEVWRDPSGRQLYLHNLSGVAIVSNVIREPRVCGGASPTFRVTGSTLKSNTLIARGMTLEPSPPKRYASPAAIWRELEVRSLVSQVEVDEALRSGEARGKPDWVKEFKRECRG
jgi:hypothetical protein